MKVLISTDCYTYQTGGITNVVLSLERGLRDLGHEVKVLALSNSGRSYKEGESYYIRSFPFVFYPEQRRSMTRRDPLLDELKAWKPDIVHIHTEASTARMARAIAREAGAPIVMTTHTDFAYFIFGRFRDAPILKKMFAVWGKRAYRRAQAVVVPSEKARSFPQLTSAADRLMVIPNGIQLERYQRPVSSEERAALFRRYGLTDNGCTLVMVTRLSREKNIAEILRYFPALLRVSPKAQLIIAGDGPERKRLEMMAERNGLAGRVRFTGRIDPDEVYRYYALGDVFVSASTFEAHSMSYLEAMACGLPLVCREDASLRGMLDDGENGIVYRTEAEFTEAVARVLGDKPLREAMRAKALVKAGEYSDRRFARCTLDLYEKISMGKILKKRNCSAMKILIASDAYVFQTSGAANVVIVLVEGLRRLGHDVRVLAPANGRNSYINGDDYFIRSIPAFVYPDVRLCPVRHDPLIDVLKRWKPDLIHLHTEASIARMAYDIAEATSTPMIITTHTDYAHFAFGRFRHALPVRFFMRACGKRLYRRAEAVVVPSEKARGFALVQAARNRVTVIPNGIRLERFQRPIIAEDRGSLLRQIGLSDNGYILVMVTRISREKNIMEILEYFPALLHALPEAQLLIVGDGPDRKRLESFVKRQGLSGHVRFTGRIDPNEVYRYYALGNVFVSASTFEVHSISYLEAIACGLPLVCREDASLQGVLDDGENGIIYRTESEFVTATARILRDDSLRESMRVKAFDKAQEYSAERFVDRTLSLYRRVLGA